MTKEEIEPFVGTFIRLECNYEAKKKIKETQYMSSAGHITKLENRFLLFEDNEEHEYLVRLDKVWNLEDLGERRTLAEAKELERIRQEKEEKAKIKKRQIGRI